LRLSAVVKIVTGNAVLEQHAQQEVLKTRNNLCQCIHREGQCSNWLEKQSTRALFLYTVTLQIRKRKQWLKWPLLAVRGNDACETFIGWICFQIFAVYCVSNIKEKM